MGWAKVESLGGILNFRPLLETATSLSEYKIIGLKRLLFYLAWMGQKADEEDRPDLCLQIRTLAGYSGKRVNTFAAENSRS